MAAGDIIIGKGIRIEVSKTFGAAKTVTAISLADPGVVTSTAHGLANKSVGYFATVAGMDQLLGQAARVAATAANTFELEDIDTTSFPAFTSGTFVPVTAWSTLGIATSITEGGGEGEKLNVTTLLDVIRKERNGLLAAETVSINTLAVTLATEALQLIRRAARTSGALVFRCTWNNGDVMLFNGEPSKPGRDVQQGAVGTGSLSVGILGLITEGSA
jgi:Phage tail tube protein, TTP